MEYPSSSIHIGNPSTPGHEHSIFPSDNRLRSDESSFLIKQQPLLETITLNNRVPLLETTIPTNSTCASDFALHTDIPRHIHSLSAMGTWYDEALFSPATTVPNVNTSNIDWYGGNIDRNSIFNEHSVYCNTPQPAAFAAMPPHYGAYLSSNELLPEEAFSIYYPDISNWINWNNVFGHIQNNQNPDAFTSGSSAINNTDPSLEASAITAPSSSITSSPQFAVNMPSSMVYTTFFPSNATIVPNASECTPETLSKNMHPIQDFYHNLTEQNITWLNTCIPDIFYRKVFDNAYGLFETQNNTSP